MRTNAEDVMNILDDTSLDEDIIEAYINSANVFVTANLASKLSAAVLTEIEKWLSAHMIVSTRERMAKKEGAGGAEIEYIGKFGEGLNGSPYGQMAISLDSSGTLQAMALLKGKAYTKAVPNFS
jgi:hypothetical protein